MDRKARDATNGKAQNKGPLREVRQTFQQTLLILLVSLGGWSLGYNLAPEFHLVYALWGLLVGFVGSVFISGVMLTLVDLRNQRLTRWKFIGVRPWVSIKDNLVQGVAIAVVTFLSVALTNYRTGNQVDATLAGYLGFVISFLISGFALMMVGLKRWKYAKKAIVAVAESEKPDDYARKQ